MLFISNSLSPVYDGFVVLLTFPIAVHKRSISCFTKKKKWKREKEKEEAEAQAECFAAV